MKFIRHLGFYLFAKVRCELYYLHGIVGVLQTEGDVVEVLVGDSTVRHPVHAVGVGLPG